MQRATLVLALSLVYTPSLFAQRAAAGRMALPRAIAPIATSVVTSRRPVFRWELAAGGTDGARVEVCRDRLCRQVVATIDATGVRGVPTEDLPVGMLYWRLKPRIGAQFGTAPGVVWQFSVRNHSADRNTAFGSDIDLNGDGFGDFPVAAPMENVGAGRVIVHQGSQRGLDPRTVILDGPVDPAGPRAVAGNARQPGPPPQPTAEHPGAGFGASMASAGDVNGDGFGDFLVGAPTAMGADNRTVMGRVFVYLGANRAFRNVAAITLMGTEARQQFGRSVAGLGDINGDGYGDIAVGAPGEASQKVFVYFGGPTGITATPAVTIATPNRGASGFGRAVASGGDLDGDGRPELVVSAPEVRIGTGLIGHVYVYRWNDGALETAPWRAVRDPGFTDGRFGASLAGPGDVNGDGLADLVVGASGRDDAHGDVHVYAGSATGIPERPTLTLAGAQPRDGFGAVVRFVGDLNEDGFTDLAVGAPGAESGAGRLFVYPGGAQGLATAALATVDAPDGAESGFGSSVAGHDLNGDGHLDLFVGASQALGRVGRGYFFLGTGAALTTPAANVITGLGGPSALFGATAE
jgi:hypothetical protein